MEPENFEKLISIDFFKRETPLYFLTHAHSDHTHGLVRSWDMGPIYLTRESARILSSLYGVNETLLHVIEVGKEIRVSPGGEEITVHTLDANHCPGAVMFVFMGEDWKVVHTGDFKMSGEIRRQAPLLRNPDVLYVDDTYDKPEHIFPPQEETIRSIIDMIEQRQPAIVNIAIYTIGKNKIIRALYEHFGQPLYMISRYRKFYEVLGLGEMVTDDRDATRFHCYSRSHLERNVPEFNPGTLTIIPTGWAVDKSYDHAPYEYIPYSEHCDYNELQEFLELTNPRKVINLVHR